MPSKGQITFLSIDIPALPREQMIMKIIAKGAAVLLVIICGVFVGAAQDKLRRVEQPAKFIYPNTPIQVEILMDGKPMPNRRAQAGPDWLKRISLEVTNTSGKDINWLMINLMLREPLYGAPKPSLETAGIFITLELPFSEPRIEILRAGERTTLKAKGPQVEYWTNYAREQGLEDIEKVMLDIKQIGFTDDTAWTRGRLSRKDPESGRFVGGPVGPKPPIPRVSPTSVLIPERDRFFF